MKNWVLAISIICFCSCEEAFFDRYPGQKLSKIPEQFHGTYHYQVGVGDTITTIIEASGWQEIDPDSNDVTLSLCDTIVLSQFEDLYFLSYQIKEQHGLWISHWLRQQGQNIEVIPVQILYKNLDEVTIPLSDFIPNYHKEYQDRGREREDSIYVFKMSEKALRSYLMAADMHEDFKTLLIKQP